MTTHRQAPSRPRYGRIALAASAVTVTAVSVLGGLGTLPAPAGADVAPRATGRAPAVSSPAVTAQPAPSPPAGGVTALDSAVADEALPAGTGEGRRVVFSESAQRVWLVGNGERVQRTYLVSGSVYDNLDPGAFEVYSRSERAWGIEDSGSMKWFVRFGYGDTGAAIGFHDIPVDEGAKVQTPAQLGTPTSHGCIRQRTRDALAMWEFAPVGTTVVVTA
ncbi:MAG: L,D-transpeptidase family protein [Nocardioides sp.]